MIVKAQDVPVPPLKKILPSENLLRPEYPGADGAGLPREECPKAVLYHPALSKGYAPVCASAAEIAGRCRIHAKNPACACAV